MRFSFIVGLGLLSTGSAAFFWNSKTDNANAAAAPGSEILKGTSDLEVADFDLHSAAAHEDVEKLTLLLGSRHAKIDQVDDNGWTPLHEATKAGNLESVKLLVNYGANLGLRTNVGGTALWWANMLHGPSHEVTKYLVSLGAPNEGDENMTADEEEPSETEGSTELHFFAAEGNIESAQELLDRDPGLLNAKDSNGWQPLHEAVQGGNVDMVRFLIDQGADISSKTTRGGTALWWGKRLLDEGHDVVQFLSSIGAPEESDASDL